MSLIATGYLGTINGKTTVYVHPQVYDTGESTRVGKNYPDDPVYKCRCCGQAFHSTINFPVEDMEFDDMLNQYKGLGDRYEILRCDGKRVKID